MKAVLCPVCNGSGEVDDYTMDGRELVTIHKKLCHGCGGKGWVEVSDEKPIDLVEELTGQKQEDWSKCPACGGDRSSPAGTGCPTGSHLGS